MEIDEAQLPNKAGLFRVSVFPIADAGTNSVAVCVILDKLIKQKIDFIKIDIEGYEFSAILGIAEIINNSRPYIVSEFSPEYMKGNLGEDVSAQFLRFFEERDFHCYHITADDIRRQNSIEETIDTYRREFERGQGHIDLLFSPSETLLEGVTAIF